MTVEQLMELLDNYGGHLAVFVVEDNHDRRYHVELTESTDEDVPCVVLHPIGDRISQ